MDSAQPPGMEGHTPVLGQEGAQGTFGSIYQDRETRVLSDSFRRSICARLNLQSSIDEDWTSKDFSAFVPPVVATGGEVLANELHEQLRKFALACQRYERLKCFVHDNRTFFADVIQRYGLNNLPMDEVALVFTRTVAARHWSTNEPLLKALPNVLKKIDFATASTNDPHDSSSFPEGGLSTRVVAEAGRATPSESSEALMLSPWQTPFPCPPNAEHISYSPETTGWSNLFPKEGDLPADKGDMPADKDLTITQSHQQLPTSAPDLDVEVLPVVAISDDGLSEAPSYQAQSTIETVPSSVSSVAVCETVPQAQKLFAVRMPQQVQEENPITEQLDSVSQFDNVDEHPELMVLETVNVIDDVVDDGEEAGELLDEVSQQSVENIEEDEEMVFAKRDVFMGGRLRRSFILKAFRDLEIDLSYPDDLSTLDYVPLFPPVLHSDPETLHSISDQLIPALERHQQSLRLNQILRVSAVEVHSVLNGCESGASRLAKLGTELVPILNAPWQKNWNQEWSLEMDTVVNLINHLNIDCLERVLAGETFDFSDCGARLRSDVAHRSSAEEQHCFCGRGNDGSTMLRCDGCEVWFHTQCIEQRFTEEELNAMETFYCDNCRSSEQEQELQVDHEEPIIDVVSELPLENQQPADDTEEIPPNFDTFSSLSDIFVDGVDGTLTQEYRNLAMKVLKVSPDYPESWKTVDFDAVIPETFRDDEPISENIRRSLIRYGSGVQISLRCKQLLECAASEIRPCLRKGFRPNDRVLSPKLMRAVRKQVWCQQAPPIKTILNRLSTAEIFRVCGMEFHDEGTSKRGVICRKARAARNCWSLLKRRKRPSKAATKTSATLTSSIDAEDEDDDIIISNSPIAAPISAQGTREMDIEDFSSQSQLYRGAIGGALSNNYRKAALRRLGITIDHPVSFPGFDVSAAIPNFMRSDPRAASLLSQKLRESARNAQLALKGAAVYRYSATRLRPLLELGVRPSNSELVPIFKHSLKRMKWMVNPPGIGYLIGAAGLSTLQQAVQEGTVGQSSSSTSVTPLSKLHSGRSGMVKLEQAEERISTFSGRHISVRNPTNAKTAQSKEMGDANVDDGVKENSLTSTYHSINDFQSVDDVIGQRRYHGKRRNTLSNDYRQFAIRILKFSLEFPANFTNFDTSPAIPEFAKKDPKLKRYLERSLISAGHDVQRAMRARHIIELALTKYRRSPKGRECPTQLTLKPFLEAVAATRSWTSNLPNVSYCLHFTGFIFKAWKAAEAASKRVATTSQQVQNSVGQVGNVESSRSYEAIFDESEENSRDEPEVGGSTGPPSNQVPSALDRLADIVDVSQVYKRNGEGVMTDSFRELALEILQITAEYPERFDRLDVSGALPEFVLQDPVMTADLTKRLLASARNEQSRLIAIDVLRKAMPSIAPLMVGNVRPQDPVLRPILMNTLKKLKLGNKVPTIPTLLTRASFTTLSNLYEEYLAGGNVAEVRAETSAKEMVSKIKAATAAKGSSPATNTLPPRNSRTGRWSSKRKSSSVGEQVMNDNDVADDVFDLNAFKSFADVYKNGDSGKLQEAYRTAALAKLQVTAEHPETFAGMDYSAVIPPFIARDPEALHELRIRLRSAGIAVQVYRRACIIMDDCTPDFMVAASDGRSITKEETAEIVRKALQARRWAHNNPTMGYMRSVLTPSKIESLSKREVASSLAQIYKNGTDGILLESFRVWAVKRFGITAEYPEAFAGFDYSPGIPSFLHGNAVETSRLTHQLRNAATVYQRSLRAHIVIRAAVPELLAATRRGEVLTDQVLTEIFEEVVKRPTLTFRPPSVGCLVKYSTKPTIEKYCKEFEEEQSGETYLPDGNEDGWDDKFAVYYGETSESLQSNSLGFVAPEQQVEIEDVPVTAPCSSSAYSRTNAVKRRAEENFRNFETDFDAPMNAPKRRRTVPESTSYVGTPSTRATQGIIAEAASNVGYERESVRIQVDDDGAIRISDSEDDEIQVIAEQTPSSSSGRVNTGRNERAARCSAPMPNTLASQSFGYTIDEPSTPTSSNIPSTSHSMPVSKLVNVKQEQQGSRVERDLLEKLTAKIGSVSQERVAEMLAKVKEQVSRKVAQQMLDMTKNMSSRERNSLIESVLGMDD